MTSILIFDTETTGKLDPEIIQASWLPIEIRNGVFQKVVDEPVSLFFKPSKAIELGAMAIHGIRDKELKLCPPSSTFEMPESDYLIGHFIESDWKIVGEPVTELICTYHLSKLLWPGLDSYSQTALLYYLFPNKARKWTKKAHTADQDVINNYRLFKRICEEAIHQHIARNNYILDDLVRLTKESQVPKTMPFGKHKDQPLASIPDDYVNWLSKQDGNEELVKHILKAKENQ